MSATGYNKRLRAASSLITSMIRVLARDTSLWSDDVWLVDSTPVGCGCSRETAKRSDLAGWAQYGYCAYADVTARVTSSASLSVGAIPTAGRHGASHGEAFNSSSIQA